MFGTKEDVIGSIIQRLRNRGVEIGDSRDFDTIQLIVSHAEKLNLTAKEQDAVQAELSKLMEEAQKAQTMLRSLHIRPTNQKKK